MSLSLSERLSAWLLDGMPNRRKRHRWITHENGERVIDPIRMGISALNRHIADVIERVDARDGSNLADELVLLAGDDWCERDNAFYCERCEEYHHQDDERAVVSSINSRRSFDYESWCESCADSQAFRCDASNETYCDRTFTCVSIDGIGNYCEEWLTDYGDDAWYWESDCQWHSEPEPEESDDDDDDDDAVIPSYHSQCRSWERDPGTIRAHDIGVELETLAPDVESLESIRSIADENGLIAERDGSLDASRGVELVGRPMPLEFYGAGGSWAKAIEALRKLGVKGYRAGEGYGMHVSINSGALPACACARFVEFIGGSKALCEFIAQRSEVHWSRYAARKAKALVRVTPKYNGGAKAYLTTTEKYESAAIRSSGNRIEVRIFRANLQWSSFARNVQFVAAVRDLALVRFGEIDTRSFLQFVADHRARYPDLFDALTRGAWFAEHCVKLREPRKTRKTRAVLKAATRRHLAAA